MRHQPLPVRRIAVEAEAHVVVDPAQPHGAERSLGHFQGLRTSDGRPVADQEDQVVGRRELGRLSESALLGVEGAGELPAGRLRPLRDRGPAAQAPLRRLLQGVANGFRGALHLLSASLPELRDPRDQLQHAHTAAETDPGNVRACEKRPPLRRHDDRERPSAPARHHLGRGHVDRVYGRPLLPVDLYRDERFVHPPGHLFVFKGLLLHDVAPVAGGVAYGEENRPILPLRRPEGFLTPGIPFHGVVGVLQEIGALLIDQPVGLVHPPQCTPRGIIIKRFAQISVLEFPPNA